MRSLDIRHIAAVGALALLVAAPLAACGADSLTPLPVQAAGAEPSASTNLTSAAAPSGSAGSGSSPPSVVRPPVVAKPTKTKSTKPRPTPSTSTTSTTSTCFGAVRYDLDLQNTVLDLQKTMCFHTGGVLRLQGIGPGEVTATPATVVSDSYAAGVVDLRFIRPGTATVTIPQDGQTHTITVVVRS